MVSAMTNRVRSSEDMGDEPTRRKQLLRSEVLAARRAMTPARRAADDAALCGHAAAAVHGWTRIAAYAPMPGEPGGRQLLAALAAQVAVVLLPVLCPDNDLDWAAYHGILDEPAVAGFRTPPGPRLGRQAIRDAEMVLVPALAVGLDGARLGRGGASYDRALIRVDPATPVLALLYSGELREFIPNESHDRPVTGVLLPDGPRSCRSPSGR
jgi:5-formyltetrahydrofolate cyclo-ligase